MWRNNGSLQGARYVSIGWWVDNTISSVENSGIWWWNGNLVDSAVSVIWWWSENRVKADSKFNTVAWWYSNLVANEWSIVGWENNVVIGRSVVVWWSGNHVDGDGSMAFWSGSKWWARSFSWNSPIVRDYSAIIVATGWVLIWTYEPVTWVNLVVEGAVKIWTGLLTENVGEIRMQSGCFYWYDGRDWHVINKQSWEWCPKVVCAYGSVLLSPGDSVPAYTRPYAKDCSQMLVTGYCYADWTFWNPGVQYYPYCYNLSGGVRSDEDVAECGAANRQAYVNSPVEWLCNHGDSSPVVSLDNVFSWTCTIWTSVKSCAMTRVYSCNGDQPVWPWVILWNSVQVYSDTLKSWTPVAQGVSPWVCQWTCKAGYSLSGNECVFDGTECVFGGYTTWNNDNFLDESFWALNGGNPTDCDIISALYGSNSSDITAYTAWRSWWQWWVDCDVSNMSVVHVSTNDQIGNTLMKNTIYVLDVDNIQSDIWFSVNGNCIAVVSSLPHWSKVLTYRSDDYKANIHPWSFSILDNLSVDGVYNANGDKHDRNHHWINVWGAYNTLNNVNVYNAWHGIVTSVWQFNVFNNMKIYNNDWDGVRLIWSDYSTFNNIQIFNNKDAWFKWSETRPTHYNIFNNVQTYNNWVWIEITSVSTNNKFNNIRVFNNGNSVINSNSTNTYNWEFEVFGNGSNWYNLTAAGAQYGWSAWMSWWNSNWWTLWDLMTNPVDVNGNYLLNMGWSYNSIRNVQSYKLINGYSYGNWIWTQKQPVWWGMGGLVNIWNYDSAKYIWSDMRSY